MKNFFINIVPKVLTYVFYAIVGVVVFTVGMLIASVGLETLRVAYSEADYARLALTSVCLSLTCVIAPFTVYYYLVRSRKYPK